MTDDSPRAFTGKLPWNNWSIADNAALTALIDSGTIWDELFDLFPEFSPAEIVIKVGRRKSWRHLPAGIAGLPL